MTAKQPQHAPVRLIIAEESENAGHELDSLLRNAGIATRTEVVDLDRVEGLLDDADMVLVKSTLSGTDSIVPKLAAAAPTVPIVLISPEQESLGTTDGMLLGAADVVCLADQEHMVLVVKRELEHVRTTSQLNETRKALEEAEQRCLLLLEGSNAAIAYVHEGMHIFANATYLEMFGFDDADELLGLPLIDLLEQDTAEALKSVLKQFRQDHEGTTLEFSGKSTHGDAVQGTMTLAAAEYEGEECIQVTLRTTGNATGESSATATQAPSSIPAENAPPAASSEPIESTTDFELTLDPIPMLGQPPEDGNGSADHVEVDKGDEQQPAQDVTSPDAGHSGDPAADIAVFMDQAARLYTTHCEDAFAAMFVVGIDTFPQLQQEHGLAGASQIGEEAGHYLRDSVTEQPLVRLSDHQFAFPITGQSRKDVLSTVDAWRAGLEERTFEVNQKTVRPSLTFGGAELVAGEDRPLEQSVDACLNDAFATMRSAMENGGNRVDLPLPDLGLSEEESESLRVLNTINEAIDNQRFILLFQPIISLRGDSDEHYEVYLRMLDTDGKQLPPGDFLRTAVENNVAGKIDRWVILQSIKQLAEHRATGHNTRLTINVSCNSVVDTEFIQWLRVAIKAARLPSDAVIFQVTEEDAAAYTRQTREFIDGLKEMHCRASLSRFGAGDNSSQLLKEIPVDYVKLDGDRIDSMVGNARLIEQVTEMISELQASGRLTIVPMVESANVLSALWQAGANYIQGQYIQEPSTTMDYDFSTDF